MKKLNLTVLLAVLCTVFSAAALADETPSTNETPSTESRLLPPWTMRECAGAQYACYDLEGARALLVLEENARHWRIEAEDQHQLVIQLDELVLNLKQQIALKDEIIETQSGRVNELVTQVNTEIAEKNKWRAEAETTDVWPLVVGGSVGLIGVGLIIGAVAGAF